MQYYDPNAIYGRRLSIGKASKYLGVSIDTLRRWESAGKIKTYRSPGGHRYFDKQELDDLFGTKYEHYNEPNVVSNQPQTINPQPSLKQVSSVPNITPPIDTSSAAQEPNYSSMGKTEFEEHTQRPIQTPTTSQFPPIPPMTPFTEPDSPIPVIPPIHKWEQIHPQATPSSNEHLSPNIPDVTSTPNIPNPHIDLDKKVDFITSDFNNSGDTATKEEYSTTEKVSEPVHNTYGVSEKPANYEEKAVKESLTYNTEVTPTVNRENNEKSTETEKKEAQIVSPEKSSSSEVLTEQKPPIRKKSSNKGNIFLVIGIILFVLLDIFLFYLWYSSTT